MTLFQRVKEKRNPISNPIPVPKWGETLFVRKLSARQKLDMVKRFETVERDDDKKIKHTADALEFAVELLACTLCDEAGVLHFDSDEGRKFLATEDFEVLNPLSDAALEFNGLGPKDTTKKK